MAVNLQEPNALHAVKGVRIAAVAAQLRYIGRDDLVIMEFAEGTQTAAVFTQNKFAAAPVMLAKHSLSESEPRALLINAGNANAVTGDQGLENARISCAEVAHLTGLEADAVLPFSTGVIGEQMSMKVFLKGFSMAVNDLGEADWLAAAKAIMTTDTVAKGSSEKLILGADEVTVTGIAKGSGMICPNMATMLSYVATDAAVSKTLLNEMLQRGVAASFNRITVDSDTSTNDALVLSATGKAMAEPIRDWNDSRAANLYASIERVLVELATAIVRDGEGATKFIRVDAINGATQADCKAVCYAIAHSPLVKTALFASDPNWGRILMAIGKAETQNLDAKVLDVTVNGLDLVVAGEPAQDYTEEAGQKVFKESELTICVSLNQGTCTHHLWTSDLSHDYVSINSDYRS